MATKPRWPAASPVPSRRRAAGLKATPPSALVESVVRGVRW